MHLPATATQVALPSQTRIMMLAAVQLLLARLLAFLFTNQFSVTDIVKSDKQRTSVKIFECPLPRRTYVRVGS